VEQEADKGEVMGYIKHDAIIVTGWQFEDLQHAAERARELGLPVIGPGEEVVNGYQSILVGPDGSKEGWDASCMADESREAFIEWMESNEDLNLDWAAVRYGGDDPELAELTRANGLPNKDAPRLGSKGGCTHAVTVMTGSDETCVQCKAKVGFP
jgi:hypothetical protein